MLNARYNQILRLLKENPQSRERRQRHEHIMELLVEEYFTWDNNHASFIISDDSSLKDFIKDYNNCVRYIQMIQQDNEELRGTDYEQGRVLKEEKALSLGYSVGYHEAHKQSKLLN